MSISESIGVITGKTTASIKLSGSFGFNHLQTQTAAVESSDGINIQSVGIFKNPFNYAYEVTPVILGSSPPTGVGDASQPPQADIQTIGPLKTAFVADPLATGAGSWWREAYGAAPDVAFNHPLRWVLNEPALTDPIPDNCANSGTGASQMDCVDIAPYTPEDPWNSSFYSMHGFFITSADNPGAGPQLGFTTAGQKLDLGVRVYNYSLAQMTQNTVVHVRFYGMLWDHTKNVQVPGTSSFLIGEQVNGPIPPFNDDPQAPLNWVVVHTPFDTTPYAGKYIVFWTVVWLQEGNALVPEIKGHGMQSVPGTLNSLADVPIEMVTDGNGHAATYSNNVGVYHYPLEIISPNPNGLGASGGDPADVRLTCVSAAKRRIVPGELDIITAKLQAGSVGSRNLSVYFYDGDPAAGARLIGTEFATVNPGSSAQASIPFYPPQQGTRRVWVVINQGQRYQSEEHTLPIVVRWSHRHEGHWNEDQDDDDSQNIPTQTAVADQN